MECIDFDTIEIDYPLLSALIR